MALPISVPYTFANATTTQSLSSLDADFSTVYNAVNGIGNGTVSLANVSITGGSVSANITSSSISSGTSNVAITSASGPVSINTNGNNAVYIDASQNLLMGTTGAVGKLGVIQSAVAIGLYVQSNTATVGYHAIYSEAQNSYGMYGRTYNASYGGIIGLNNDNTVYGILGSGVYGLLTNASIYVNGTVYASDGRLKENVKPIENSLSIISALNPVSFDWKEKSSRGPSSDFGLIAQEVEKVIPECVFEAKTPARTPEMTHKVSLEEELGTYKGVDYSRFIPFLIAAVKELSAKNDALEARLVALESK
jgi:hypothetical protein